MQRIRENFGKQILGTLLYAAAVLFAMSAGRHLQQTHLLLEDSISASRAAQIQQLEWEEAAPVGFCFWGENPKQTITCRETGASVQVTQRLLAGNPGLLEGQLLAWQAGCLVDVQTAQTLFGTAAVGGQRLWHQGTEYPVLGTIEDPRPTMVLLAPKEAQLNRLVLALPPEEGAVAAPQCLMRWGIQGDVLDYQLLWSAVRNVLLLFPGILGAMFCTHLAKGWRELSISGIRTGKQGRLLGRCLLSAAAAVLLGLLLGRHIHIPENMIPTRWSDFSFWQRWWSREKENSIRLLFQPPQKAQLQMLLDMVKSMVASIAACLVLLWPKRRKNHADIADRGR